MPTTRPSGLVVPEGTDAPDFDGTIFPDLAESIENNFPSDADLTAHSNDTTGVHGIADTSTLYRAGGTDVSVADGGTGASNAVNARTNLGLVIGTDVAAQHAHPYEASGAVAAHETDTTTVHGIADTSLLATDAEVASAIAAHEADTSNVHGITDTTVLATDAEVATAISNHEAASNPHAGYATDADLTAHAETPHGGGGEHPDLAAHDALGLATDAELSAHEGASDPHTGYQKESEKAAASGYASLDSTTKVPTAQLGTGTADSTKFLRGDRTWETVGSASHPDLSAHDVLGLATDDEVTSAIATHAATPHAGDHPDSDHNTLATITTLNNSINTHATQTGGHDSVDIAFPASGNLSATNVQAALEELDSEKASTGSVTSAISAHEAAANPHAGYATDGDLSAHAADTELHDTTLPTTFSKTGELAVTIGSHRWYANRNYDIDAVRASVGVASTGASVIVDVHKNGTTIFTTQANRPEIAASGNTDITGTPDVTSLAAGDYLTIDIDQIGSTLPGEDLTVQVYLRAA